MTINQTDEDGITNTHAGLGNPLSGRMLWQADQSKFFTPEPERESVKHDMTSEKKNNFAKPMSFIDKEGIVTEGINFGSQAISELETDLPAVETQIGKGEYHQQTP